MLIARFALLPMNPRHPISNGKHHVFYSFSLQLLISSSNFAAFLSCVSSIRSSHGTVNSRIMHLLLCLNIIMISGRCLVTEIFIEKKNSCFLRSALSFQSLAVPSIPLDASCFSFLVFSPWRTKAICFFWDFVTFAFWNFCSRLSFPELRGVSMCIYAVTGLYCSLTTRAPSCLAHHIGDSWGHQ